MHHQDHQEDEKNTSFTEIQWNEVQSLLAVDSAKEDFDAVIVGYELAAGSDE